MNFSSFKELQITIQPDREMIEFASGVCAKPANLQGHCRVFLNLGIPEDICLGIENELMYYFIFGVGGLRI